MKAYQPLRIASSDFCIDLIGILFRSWVFFFYELDFQCSVCNSKINVSFMGKNEALTHFSQVK